MIAEYETGLHEWARNSSRLNSRAWTNLLGEDPVVNPIDADCETAESYSLAVF